MLGNEAPLCTGNLLDQREHHYAKKADGSYDNSRLKTKTGSCHLTRYTQAEAVGCLDALYDHLTENSPIKPYLNLLSNSRKRVHIAFVGDSRIRQQFHNFLKVVRSMRYIGKKMLLHNFENFLPHCCTYNQISWFLTTIWYFIQIHLLFTEIWKLSATYWDYE